MKDTVVEGMRNISYEEESNVRKKNRLHIMG